jgi:hypothetical protein
MPSTSPQSIHDEHGGADGDARVGDVEHREAPNLEEVEHVPERGSVDQVSSGSRQDEGQTEAEERAEVPDSDEDHDEDDGDDGGDRQEDVAVARESPESPPRVVDAGEPDHVPEERQGHPQGERLRGPELCASIESDEQDGKDDPEGPAHDGASVPAPPQGVKADSQGD